MAHMRAVCLLVLAAAVAACSPSLTEDDAESLENTIRETYEERGAEVIEVDIDVADERNLEGTVRLRDPENGMEVTNDCTAELEEGETEYQWTCVPPGE